MTRGNLTVWTRRSLVTTATFIALSTALAGPAWATCFTTTGKPLAVKAQFAASAAARVDDDFGSATIVGLWNSEFQLGDGTPFDQSFQQFHSDGTEMMLSRGLPPPLGNVCVGVWKLDGRSYKLKHMAWNWDDKGNYISIFVMEVNLRVDRRGNRYTGTWSSDNLKPTTGEPIVGEHFEGTVRGTRITAD